MIITVTLNTSIDRTLEVQNFRAGEVLKGRCIATLAAGKGVNVSRCLAALGRGSIATGFVGRADARLFEDSFEGTVVRPDFVTVDGTTRRNTTILDPTSGTETHIRESGFGIARSDVERLKQKLHEIVRTGCHVVFAGSLPLGASSEDFQRLLQACVEKNCDISVDTSGKGLSALRDVGASIPLFSIKPNSAELAEIVEDAPLNAELDIQRSKLEANEGLPDIRAMVAAARTLLDRAQIILVTLGEEGALCVESDSAWRGRLSISQEQVVNTVGCGDAFLAGFLAGIESGEDRAGSLRLALACGAACALSPTAGTIDAEIARKLERQALLEPASTFSAI